MIDNLSGAMLKVGLNSLVAQRVKHLPGMRETRVRSLGQGRSPGEGNDNPLQYSCLENPMDRRGWWATVHRVEHNQTRLKTLSTHAQPSSQAVTGNFKKLWKARAVWEN